MGKMAFNATISSSGDEVAFMKEIIDYITNIDTSITCLDDPDDEYDVETVTTSHRPVFRFCINNTNFFNIERKVALSTNSNEIIFKLLDGSGNEKTSMNLRIGANAAWNVSTTRQTFASFIFSNNLLIINMHGTVSYSKIQLLTGLYIISGDNAYMSSKIYNNELSYTDYILAEVFNISSLEIEGLSSATSGTFLSRFTYKAQPGKVDYIKSSIYVNNNTKQFDLIQIYDCTEVSPGSTVSLEDGAYLAVGPHQLVKVS